MEQINIEQIMKEIRADIKARNLKDNASDFSEITCMLEGSDIPFDMDEYIDDIEQLSDGNVVLSYRDVSSSRKLIGPVITLIKKVLRKFMCFYIEPIVDDQNRFNVISTRVLSQTVRRYKDEDDRIKELEKELENCQKVIKELEKRIKKVEG